jgi:hypothetical protein
MLLTPSAKSSGLAGFGLGFLLWTFIFKLDTLAKLFHVNRWVKRERTLNWIADNGGLFLAGTAAANLSVHGTSSPIVVPMTLCMELFNTCMVLMLKVWKLGTRRRTKFV